MIIANSTLLIQRMFPVEKYSLNEKAIAMVKAVMMLFFNICFPPFVTAPLFALHSNRPCRINFFR